MQTSGIPLIPFVVTQTESGVTVELVGSLVKFHKGDPEAITMRLVQPFGFIPNSDWTLTDLGEATYERLIASGMPIGRLYFWIDRLEVVMVETVDELEELTASLMEAAIKTCHYRPKPLLHAVLSG